jgi:hypothetical protein
VNGPETLDLKFQYKTSMLLAAVPLLYTINGPKQHYPQKITKGFQQEMMAGS